MYRDKQMAMALSKLRGMSPKLRSKLGEIGIRNTDQLLEMCRTPIARRDIADFANVDMQVILGLANRADLARVDGIGTVLADLLEETGVDTLKELAIRNPEKLRSSLLAVNAEKQLAGRTPSVDMVRKWVSQARSLPKALEY